MGTFVYDTSHRVEVDDRTLAHLQPVIVAKLRRNESFTLEIVQDAHSAERGVFWLHASIPIYFEYHGTSRPTLNREWLDHLMNSANSTAGLVAVPEPVHAIRQAALAGA